MAPPEPEPEPPKKRIGFLVEEPHVPYKSREKKKQEWGQVLNLDISKRCHHP